MSATADPEKNLVPELGILGVEIDPRIAAAANGLRDPVRHHRRRARAGATSEVPLLPSDIIRSLNNASDGDTRRVSGTRCARSSRARPVTLQIQREGRLMYVSFTME